MSDWICARCGKNLHDVLKTDGAAFPIDHMETKNRRWVCDKCVNRNEVSDDVLKLTNDISEVLNDKSVELKGWFYEF